MLKTVKSLIIIALAAMIVVGCDQPTQKKTRKLSLKTPMEKNLEQFAEYIIEPDFSNITDNEKKLLPVLIEVSDIMDELFWQQTFGDKAELFDGSLDENELKFVEINYGPWEKLNGDFPFIRKYGRKPLGSNFYPADITRKEFDAFEHPDKSDPYTLLRRDKEGKLIVVPYSEAFKAELQKASELMLQAAGIADNPSMKKYFEALAEDFLKDDYEKSTRAWLDMTNHNIDFVAGPVEVYEDKFMGFKTAFTAMVFTKDKEWTEKLDKYRKIIPLLEKELPLDEKYKKNVKTGNGTQLCVYDMIYVKGFANTDAKPVAISLPNDYTIAAEKGSRNIQNKNIVKAKFEKILLPIADILIDSAYRKHITFDAFFNNIMFQKMSNLIGVADFIEGKDDAREALREKYSILEETKADMLGIFMVQKLYEMKEVGDGVAMDEYTTYLASLFRSVRFGCTNVQGKTNMLIFNFFIDFGAFVRNPDGGYYADPEKVEQAADLLLKKNLVLQGNRDYKGVASLFKQKGNIRLQLMKDLDKLSMNNIPVDIYLNQSKVKNQIAIANE